MRSGRAREEEEREKILERVVEPVSSKVRLAGEVLSITHVEARPVEDGPVRPIPRPLLHRNACRVDIYENRAHDGIGSERQRSCFVDARDARRLADVIAGSRDQRSSEL